MRQMLLQKGDQELVFALMTSLMVLPFLAEPLSRALAFLIILGQLQILGKIHWKKLGRKILAPLGFLILSSLALYLGRHDHILDLLSRSLFASVILVLLSMTLKGSQWFELAFQWRMDGLLLTLSLLALRWMQISENLWKSMDKGWRMRSQLSGFSHSMKTFGWRIARIYQLHEQRVHGMDLGWNARGLAPILQIKSSTRQPFAWTVYLLYLAPPVLIYGLSTLLIGRLT